MRHDVLNALGNHQQYILKFEALLLFLINIHNIYNTVCFWIKFNVTIVLINYYFLMCTYIY